MVEDNKKIYKEIMDYLKHDNELKNFMYYNDFCLKWNNYLQKYCYENTLMIPKNISDNDQMYIYNIKFKNFSYDLRFSIGYLREIYIKHKEDFPKITLDYDNGSLSHNGFLCNYTIEDTNTESYNDINDIFVIPIGLQESIFTVIDGNHRVSKQIKEEIKSINAVYIDFIYAARSLMSAFESCIYCLLEDIHKIKYNLNNLEHKQLYSLLNIKNTKKVLDVLGSRIK